MKILFNGQEYELDKVQQHIGTVNVVTDHLDLYNQNFPDLTTPFIVETVKTTRKVMANMGRVKVMLEVLAKESVEEHGLDKALSIIKDELGIAFDLDGLVKLIGIDAYEQALIKDMHSQEYMDNCLSPDQIAYLWNELKRPVPGGSLRWTEMMVTELEKRKLI